MPTKVYYNSACPVCKAGIEKQRQQMEKNGVQGIEWVDVHNHPAAVEETGHTLEQVRERLHVADPGGRLLTGIDAFICLWQQTPALRWLGAILQLPVINPLARAGYNSFARLLYRWNRLLRHW